MIITSKDVYSIIFTSHNISTQNSNIYPDRILRLENINRKRPKDYIAHMSNKRHDKSSFMESKYKIYGQCGIVHVDPVLKKIHFPMDILMFLIKSFF